MGYICEECGFHLDGGVEYKKVWLVSCEVTANLCTMVADWEVGGVHVRRVRFI